MFHLKFLWHVVYVIADDIAALQGSYILILIISASAGVFIIIISLL